VSPTGGIVTSPAPQSSAPAGRAFSPPVRTPGVRG
jgi:hypothetical protein